MKKLFVGCSTVILILGVIMFIIFYAYKTYIVKDLNARNNQVESIWVSFIYKENLKNKKILNLLDSFEFENSDSLRLHISKNLNINDTLKCNEEFVYQEYLMNKYFMKTFNIYLKRKELLMDNKDKFDEILKDIEEQNIILENYDSNVRSFNSFIGTFPNFIIAKSNGFKMKKYFQIKFGEENKDPKQVRKETIEWIKQIEREQGVSE
jgi:hypothetical protein